MSRQTDEAASALAPYIHDGVVTPKRPNLQLAAEIKEHQQITNEQKSRKKTKTKINYQFK